jgi:hypothetical protein
VEFLAISPESVKAIEHEIGLQTQGK